MKYQQRICYDRAMKECLFCRIVAREIPGEIVHESNEWIGLVDIKPVNLGHTLLIPKAHHETLFDLPKELLATLGSELGILARNVQRATSADGINIGMNNYAAAGQLVRHAHIHIIPRFENDGHRHWHGKRPYSKEELAEIATKIRNI